MSDTRFPELPPEYADENAEVFEAEVFHSEGQALTLSHLKIDAPPMRILAIVALAAGAGLLLTGKRKAGVTVAAIGTALALLEDPDVLGRIWTDLPALLGSAQQTLERAEQVVQDVTGRGEQLRNVLSRAANR